MKSKPALCLTAAIIGLLSWNVIGAHSDIEARRWFYKALDAYDRKDFGAAKTSLAMALQTEPNFSEAYLLRGMLEYNDGQVEKATASWQRALQLNPRLPQDMRKELEKKAHAIESHLTEQDFSHFHLRSEEHTSELQSPDHLVCRLLLEKKKQTHYMR